MSDADKLVERIVVETAKELAKGINIDKRELTVLLAEILANNYKHTYKGNDPYMKIVKNAEAKAEDLIANMIKSDTELA
jgi:hypothetical protein